MEPETIFLSVRCGDFVAISSATISFDDWWIGEVIGRVGSSGDPSVNTLFQVIDIDNGSVKIISASFVRGIIKMTSLSP